MAQILSGIDLDPVLDLTFTKAKINANGRKQVGILNTKTKKGVYLSTPLMLTWGVNEYLDDKTGSKSYDMALQFDPQKSTSQHKFLEAMKTLENKVKDDAVTNAKKWFGKKTSREVVDALMYPILKYPKKKDGSGEPDHDRNPTLKLKIPFWDGKYNIELYDMSGEPAYVPEDTARKMGIEPPQGARSPSDIVPKASHVKGLLACTGVWMAGGRFGVTWKLVQACVRPPVRLVGSGMCHIADDSDDEEMDANLNKYDATKDEGAGAYKEEVTGPTFDESDDEEEVEDEDEDDDSSPVSTTRPRKSGKAKPGQPVGEKRKAPAASTSRPTKRTTAVEVKSGAKPRRVKAEESRQGGRMKGKKC